MTGRAGMEPAIAGVTVLRCRDDGSVVEQRDVWALEPGSRDLPEWARSYTGRS